MADYIDNKQFYALLIEYKKKCKEAEENGNDVPRIPENIGNCFYLIASKLSSRPNFVNYTYKDEMISDALENCVVAVHSFNPEKSSNPFSYFTQIIWYAFIRRIEKEKKQTYVKYKSLENLIIDNEFLEDENGNGYANFDLTNEKMKPIIEKFEKKNNLEKKKPVGIEKFVDNDE